MHQRFLLIKACVNPMELTAEPLNLLIKKNLAPGSAKVRDGSRVQEAKIFYLLIGKIG